MATETRTCQNCKNSFAIEPDDFAFYEKIKVPSPTWCPTCRIIRRMMWGFDGRTLYERECDAPGHTEKMYSSYAPEVKNPVYDYEYWRSDAWDPMQYGRAYNFERPFFEQFKELLDVMPTRNLEINNSINCDYCKTATDSKDCYLSTAVYASERCFYCHTVLFCKECVSTDLSILDEHVYDSFSLDKSFRTTHGVYSAELLNCNFMYDCRSCSDCLGCVNLRNKRYCIFNVQYTKQAYERERTKHDLGSYRALQSVRQNYEALRASSPKKYAVIKNATSCSGDNIINAKNVHYAFQVLNDVEDCKYAFVIGRGAKECFDVSGAGLKSTLLYECVGVTGGQRVFFSNRVYNSHDIYYSRDCHDSAYLFGCVGLRNKKYCILNRQYTSEEYERMRGRIIDQMNALPYRSHRGQLYQFGDFFPSEHSPLFYNDAWVSEYFPLRREEALRRGFRWNDRVERDYAVTLPSEKLPDHIKDVPDAIASEVIGCHHQKQCLHACTGAFRILPKELELYRGLNIAVPRLCPNCRYSEHLAYLNPYKLWSRQCMCQSRGAHEKGHSYQNVVQHFHRDAPCPNVFETAYAPERPDLIYCESCYNSEVA